VFVGMEITLGEKLLADKCQGIKLNVQMQ